MNIDAIIVALYLIAMVFLLVYIAIKYDKFSVKGILNNAVKTSEYKPTMFEIYDKSSEDVCDRLIIIKPFDWYLWNTNDELYVLNPENGMFCGAGSTPAIRILKSDFIKCCLKVDFDSIIRSYKQSTKHVIEYDMDKTVFTIFTALNILCKKYIKFAVSDALIPEKITDIELDEDIETKHYEYVSNLRGKITQAHVIQLMSIHEKTNNDLIHAYNKHVKK